jgi:hypothetical protein
LLPGPEGKELITEAQDSILKDFVKTREIEFAQAALEEAEDFLAGKSVKR